MGLGVAGLGSDYDLIIASGSEAKDGGVRETLDVRWLEGEGVDEPRFGVPQGCTGSNW